jgi:hypothetical protein
MIKIILIFGLFLTACSSAETRCSNRCAPHGYQFIEAAGMSVCQCGF